MANEAHNETEPKGLFDQTLLERTDNPAASIAEAVARGLQCDEVHVTLTVQPEKQTSAIYALFRNKASPGPKEPLFRLTSTGIFYGNSPLQTPLSVNDLSRARLPLDLANVLANLGVKSFGVFKIIRTGVCIGYISCFYKKNFHRWRSDELAAIQSLGDSLSHVAVVEDDTMPASKQMQARFERYQHLATRGNIIIVTTDRDFRVQDIFGNSELLLGVRPKDIQGNPSIWQRLVDARDAARLLLRVRRLKTSQAEVQEEVRIIHQTTGEVRCILLRALPSRDETGHVVGWEGFGVDVTERRQAQDALRKQKARLQALFEVSRTVGEFKDPATVTLQGLRAVLKATRSDCGYAVFCDRETGRLEVVAAIGLSETYLANMDNVLDGPSLLRDAITGHERFLIPDLQKDSRAVKSLAQIEKIHATIVVPLTFENIAYGGIVLFKRTPDSYDEDDYDVAISAASQLTLAVRQAELLEVQRQQSASLSALYRVSRELAKYRHTVDFSEQIFPTFQSEFALKRCWIGMTNNAGTFVVGRAAFGAGVSPDITTTQIQISGANPILEELMRDKTPIILDEPEEEPQEALLGLFNQPSSLVIVPMVTIGQVMGVIVLEPLSKRTFCSSERLQLLVSMASEIATAMMAGRFEHRMTNAVKMRTAGLLASGVAHNFNNILQAIIGHASIVQLRAKGDDAISKASHSIQEAAMRGATLVNHLLSFASKRGIQREPLDVARFVADSTALYESFFGKEICLTIDNQLPEAASVRADSAQLQQVITSLLANAKDALTETSQGEVTISTHSVVVQAGELSPELTPGSYIRIDVRDNGVGMEQEEQTRCFEPFFTTKNVDPETGVGLSGSGLGLAAAYAIIREHDGAITVHSRPGDGSTFSIYLPRCPDTNLAQERSHARSSAGILLVNLGSSQPFIAQALETLGYHVEWAPDLAQAQELLRGGAEQWRILVLDRKGIADSRQEHVQELLSLYPELSIVCLSDRSHPNLAPTHDLHPSSRRLHWVKRPITAWDLEIVLQKVLHNS